MEILFAHTYLCLFGKLAVGGLLSLAVPPFFDLERGDSAQRAKMAGWEAKHMAGFRATSKTRIVKELAGVDTLSVPGTHMDFVFNSRDQIAAAIIAFLAPAP